MKRTVKNLTALGVLLFLALGIWCAGLAAPGLPLAPVSGCPHSSRGIEMDGCDRPSYLCGLDLNFQGAFTSASSNDLAKRAHDLSIGEVAFDASKNAKLILETAEDMFLVRGPGKVSTRLLNSILNL